MAPSHLESSVPLWNPAQAVSTRRLAQALEKEPLLPTKSTGSEKQQLPTGAGPCYARPSLELLMRPAPPPKQVAAANAK